MAMKAFFKLKNKKYNVRCCNKFAGQKNYKY